MKILYIDQIIGLSGDMLLSALLDLTGKKDLEFINFLPSEFKNLKIKKVLKNAITATQVVLPEIKNEISYYGIIKLVEKSRVNNEIKIKVKETIKTIAEVESKIHTVPLKNFHFHNYTDLVIELFGVFYLIKKFGVEKIYSSPVKLSRGFVNCIHGTLPVPAPATIELCKDLPTEYIDINTLSVSPNTVANIHNQEKYHLQHTSHTSSDWINMDAETTTPTGVAILKILNPEFQFPKMVIKKIGYGAGEKCFNAIPNVLRVIIGEDVEQKEKYLSDTIIKLETNIDDMNPLFYEPLIEKLYSLGCYEIFLTNTMNKKFRPGILLTVLLPKENLYKVCKTIFNETTTSGIRIQEMNRVKLFRENKIVKTKYGNINVKTVKFPDGKKVFRPEYDDLKTIAKKYNLPIKDVYPNIYFYLNKK